MPELFKKVAGETIDLAIPGIDTPVKHVFDEDVVHALNGALAARRPLLVRGEPGTGKSQLAFAAAEVLERSVAYQVVDARTEARDLLWTYDAVGRLGEAQVQATLPDCSEAQVRENLRPIKFVQPGVMWWAYDWKDAEQQAMLSNAPRRAARPGWQPSRGVVILIDEIDKGDADVPNGLLECLGNRSFHPLGRDEPVVATGEPPLVIVTTNEERALPDAFLRRCLVLKLELSRGPKALTKFLMERGEAHFSDVTQDVRRKVAELLIEDREQARKQKLSPPGQAEYLDMLRALVTLDEDEAAQLARLEKLREFTFRKHPEERDD